MRRASYPAGLTAPLGATRTRADGRPLRAVRPSQIACEVAALQSEETVGGLGFPSGLYQIDTERTILFSEEQVIEMDPWPLLRDAGKCPVSGVPMLRLTKRERNRLVAQFCEGTRRRRRGAGIQAL